ncbi:WhiB family transcriptional regulator [Embleya sp. NPDC020886]|uniref:WhiB family transcriptional regulator n=1 Tax=Embleya sp. NPDC020886 TaxID=3363980 RepID=UPI0037960267
MAGKVRLTGALSAPVSSVGTAWKRSGACRDADPDLFFPTSESSDVLQVKAAQAVCRECPVARLCLIWAMETNQRSGIWGGKTTGQRGGLKSVASRRRNRARRRDAA